MINSALGYIYKTISNVGASEITADGVVDIGDGSKSIWIKQPGTRKVDRCPVLTLSLVTSDDLKRTLALNGVKKLRTLKHPSILKFIFENVSNTSITLCTEWGLPVESFFNKLPEPNLILWGLFKILSALEFLHINCKISHNNVNLNSMYITSSEEWKLGDFEWAHKDGDRDLSGNIVSLPRLRPTSSICPPEGYPDHSETHSRQYPIHSYDVWCFGLVTIDLIKQAKKSTTSSLYTGIYNNLIKSLSDSFLNNSPFKRDTTTAFLANNLEENGCFDTKFIRIMNNLEDISVKTPSERTAIFRDLRNNTKSFSIELRKLKILPILANTIECSESDINLTESLLEVSQGCNEQDFNTYLRPAIKKIMFSKNHEVCSALVEKAYLVYPKSKKNAYSSEIIEFLTHYLAASSPYVRDRVTRACINYVDHLTLQDYNKLLSALYERLQDQEYGIRVNTIICFAMLFNLHPARSNKSMIITVFTNSLTDSNSEVRVAALSSIVATVNLYSAKDLITIVIPKLLPTVMDPNETVRSNFSNTMEVLLKTLKNLAEVMHSNKTRDPAKLSHSTRQINSLPTVSIFDNPSEIDQVQRATSQVPIRETKQSDNIIKSKFPSTQHTNIIFSEYSNSSNASDPSEGWDNSFF